MITVYTQNIYINLKIKFNKHKPLIYRNITSKLIAKNIINLIANKPLYQAMG